MRSASGHSPPSGYSRSAPDLTFSPSGKTLVLRSYGGLQFWDVGLGIKVFDLKHSGPFTFSPDGRLLATGNATATSGSGRWRPGRPSPSCPAMTGRSCRCCSPPTAGCWRPAARTTRYSSGTLAWARLGGCRQKAKLDDDERAKAWTALSESDAGAAQQALGRPGRRSGGERRLAASAPLRRPRCRRPSRCSVLGGRSRSANSARREKAFNELKNLGKRVEPELLQALTKKPALEVQRRLERLVQELRSDEVASRPRRRLAGVACVLRRARIAGHAGSTAAAGTSGQGGPRASETQTARSALQRLGRDGPLQRVGFWLRGCRVPHRMPSLVSGPLLLHRVWLTPRFPSAQRDPQS